MTTGCIAAVHGRFNGSRQVTPICAHLIMLSWANTSPQTKRRLDRFSHFCTAHHKVSLYFAMGGPFPIKLTSSYSGVQIPIGIVDSRSPVGIWTSTQTASRSVQPFLQGSLKTDRQLDPTNRQTDTPRYCWSVTIGHVYVRLCDLNDFKTYYMAVVCGMPTIQCSARSAWLSVG